MAYSGIGWQNEPSTVSPINAANLGIMDNELIYLDGLSENINEKTNAIIDDLGTEVEKIKSISHAAGISEAMSKFDLSIKAGYKVKIKVTDALNTGKAFAIYVRYDGDNTNTTLNNSAKIGTEYTYTLSKKTSYFTLFASNLTSGTSEFSITFYNGSSDTVKKRLDSIENELLSIDDFNEDTKDKTDTIIDELGTKIEKEKSIAHTTSITDSMSKFDFVLPAGYKVKIKITDELNTGKAIAIYVRYDGDNYNTSLNSSAKIGNTYIFTLAKKTSYFTLYATGLTSGTSVFSITYYNDGNETVEKRLSFVETELDELERSVEEDIGQLNDNVEFLNNKVGEFKVIPTLRNGSVGNKYNENYVATGWKAEPNTIVDAVSVGDIVSVEVSRPLSEETNRYTNGYSIFNSEKTEIYKKDVSVVDWYENIVIPADGAYIAFAIGEFTSGSSVVPLRTTDFSEGDVKLHILKYGGIEQRLEVLEEESGTNVPRIVRQNKDVKLAVDACGKFGLHSGGQLNTQLNFTMLVTTDVHQETENMSSAIDYLNTMDAIMCGCCLGDIAAGNYAQTDGTWYTNRVNNSSKPFYTLIGNHDGGNSKDSSISATVENTFNKWIKPTLSKIGIDNLTVPYYKIDTNYNVTLIILNNYDVPDTMDGDNFAVSRGAEVISQTQINWLLDALDNVPVDNHLLVMMHSYPYANNAVSGNFTQPNYTPVGNSSPAYAEIIPDIINAWRLGEELQKTYQPQTNVDYLSSVSIDHDFSGRGQGIFCGYLVGHTHKDIMAVSSIYSGQNIYCLTDTAGGTWQNEGSDLPRVAGEKSQDAITVIGIDTVARIVKLVRIGSNKTTRMVDRTMIAIDY